MFVITDPQSAILSITYLTPGTVVAQYMSNVYDSALSVTSVCGDVDLGFTLHTWIWATTEVSGRLGFATKGFFLNRLVSDSKLRLSGSGL